MGSRRHLLGLTSSLRSPHSAEAARWGLGREVEEEARRLVPRRLTN